jgi:dihydrolipoamide dehydrogenase
MTYDLIIIGGGPAGYHAAGLAGRAGLSVLLVEKRAWGGGSSAADGPAIGGVCLHEGCIPTKTLLHSARLLDQAHRAERYGLRVTGVALEHSLVLRRKMKIVKTLEKGILAGLKRRGVAIVGGSAVIAGRTGNDFTITAGGKAYAGRRLLIATGSVPAVPRLPGIEEGSSSGFIVTSREILEWETVPSSLAVVGAGAIGLEFAAYFNSLGTKVTVIEMLPRIGGTLDAEAAAALQKHLERAGIAFRLRSQVTGFTAGSVSFHTPAGPETVRAERALLSVGRRPFTEGLGLESIGLETERGNVSVDERGRTAFERVWAAGDVTGRFLLAHAAFRDAEAAVADMLGKSGRSRVEVVPSVIYTSPEAAWAGESEESARAKGIEYQASVNSLRHSGRFLVENEGGDGLCKLLVTKKEGKLIGAHLVGDPASEIIFGAALLIDRGASLGDMRRMIFPHPTVSEIFKEAALLAD